MTPENNVTENQETKNKDLPLNYPILLLIFVTVFSLKGIFSSITGIFARIASGPLSAVNGLLSLFTNLFLPALLVLLWADQAKKVKKARSVIATLALVCSLINLYFLIMNAVRVLPNMMGDIHNVLIFVPSILKILGDFLIYLTMACCMYKNSNKLGGVRALCVLFISVLLFFGIVNAILSVGSVGNILVTVLSYIAIWYIPSVFTDPQSAEITKGKFKTLAFIIAIVLVIYILAGATTGSGLSVSTTNNADSNKCGSCNRTYKAGDAGGNYMNIAKTGLCIKCEDNLHRFEWVLD